MYGRIVVNCLPQQAKPTGRTPERSRRVGSVFEPTIPQRVEPVSLYHFSRPRIRTAGRVRAYGRTPSVWRSTGYIDWWARFNVPLQEPFFRVFRVFRGFMNYIVHNTHITRDKVRIAYLL